MNPNRNMVIRTAFYHGLGIGVQLVIAALILILAQQEGSLVLRLVFTWFSLVFVCFASYEVKYLFSNLRRLL